MNLHLAATPAAARRARSCVRHLLARHAVPAGTAEVLELLLTEVVTNAVRHGAVIDTFQVTVTTAPDGVTVRVTDDNPARPLVLDPPPEALGGRGMQLVDRLADDWGVDTHASGKTLWFRVGLDEPAWAPPLAG